MIPGEFFLRNEAVEANQGRATERISVTNTGDRPIQVGSHCHFYEVNRALNFGQPFILNNPDLPICLLLEKMAYALSDDSFKAIPPAVPSPTWKRVTGSK